LSGWSPKTEIKRAVEERGSHSFGWLVSHGSQNRRSCGGEGMLIIHLVSQLVAETRKQEAAEERGC